MIVFYVMSSKGFSVLNAVLPRYAKYVKRIITCEDKAVLEDYTKDIRELASDYNIPCFFRGGEPKNEVSDYIFSISWRWLIDHHENRLIVFHDSLLPRYRGFAPLVNMLINKEDKIGVTAIFGAKGYDEGAIIAQASTRVTYPIKIIEAINLNMSNFERLALELVDKIAAGDNLVGSEQKESEATYSIWRDEQDYRIDWSCSASDIRAFVDAVGYPYLGAKTKIDDETWVTVHDVEEVEDRACELRHLGKVIYIENGMPVVICGEGLIKIKSAVVTGSNQHQSLLPLNKFRVRFF